MNHQIVIFFIFMSFNLKTDGILLYVYVKQYIL